MNQQTIEAAPDAMCGLCGEPMPQGEEMFKVHVLSKCRPKPPIETMQDDTDFCDDCKNWSCSCTSFAPVTTVSRESDLIALPLRADTEHHLVFEANGHALCSIFWNTHHPNWHRKAEAVEYVARCINENAKLERQLGKAKDALQLVIDIERCQGYETTISREAYAALKAIKGKE